MCVCERVCVRCWQDPVVQVCIAISGFGHIRRRSRCVYLDNTCWHVLTLSPVGAFILLCVCFSLICNYHLLRYFHRSLKCCNLISVLTSLQCMYKCWMGRRGFWGGSFKGFWMQHKHPLHKTKKEKKKKQQRWWEVGSTGGEIRLWEQEAKFKS